MIAPNMDKQAKPKLPLIISGAASKMRGQHRNFANWQEQHYKEMDYIWGKDFVWGFANINLNINNNALTVDFLYYAKGWLRQN